MIHIFAVNDYTKQSETKNRCTEDQENIGVCKTGKEKVDKKKEEKGILAACVRVCVCVCVCMYVRVCVCVCVA